MELLGTVASSFRSAGSFESIASVTLTSSSSTVTFSSIPGTYKHLHLRYSANGSAASQYVYLKITLNNDNGSNYAQNQVYSEGPSTAGAEEADAFNQTVGWTPQITADSVRTTDSGIGYVDIYEYANTSKLKTLRALGGLGTQDADIRVQARGTLWNSTAAITTITLAPNSGSLRANSVFALYGIKGA